MTEARIATRKRKEPQTSSKLYVLRVDLMRVQPAIWRRLEVPGNGHLGKLHEILQVAFSWTDSHMHNFEIGGAFYGAGDSDVYGMEERPEDEYLIEHLVKANSRFLYTYDFGDDWIHSIKVEKVVPPEAGVHYPRCTAGKNAAPPDDCGGPWGYTDMLKALADPAQPEREEYLEWLGEDFDPTEFDLEEINAQLRRVKL